MKNKCEPPFDYVSPDDIDDFEALDQILKGSGINILNDKELDTVVLNDGEIVGSLWVGRGREDMTFDIVVSDNCRRKGIAKQLIKNIIQTYKFDREGYGENYKLIGDVVNPYLVPYLQKTGFNIKEIVGGHTIMEYEENE